MIMARMFPDQLDPATKSMAERRLYEAFRDELEDSYLVFHQVAWLALDRQKHPHEGEADFVLAHPRRGVLVLEVKGGAICRDPHTNGWTSIDAAGQVNIIKNPVEQAKESKYALLDQLKEAFKHYIVIGHAVAFPDVVVGEKFLGMDLPRQIVLDATDLPHICRWVEQAIDYWDGRHRKQDSPLGPDGIQALISLLGKQWELRPALWGQFSAEEEHLLRLTEEQYALLDALNRHRRVLISGFAGSGKTLLAVEKATRLAHQGFRTLFTCFNRSLATDIRTRLELKAIPGGSLDILNFHELCKKLAKKAHVKIPEGKEDAEFFEHLLPNILLEVSKVRDLCYDAIIVDEGQDFLDAWWLPLQYLLHDPDDGILYIFYDDNQRLYNRKNAYPLAQPPYQLTVNCRTTQRIHRQILACYQGDLHPVAKGPEGRPVELHYYTGREHLQEALLSELNQLTVDEHIPVGEIAVLTPFSHRTSRIQPQEATNRVGLDWFPGTNQVQLDTVHSFKGLERAVVVLVEMERWLTQGVKAVDIDKVLYVGCSRARNHLIVLLSRQAPLEVRQFFALSETTSSAENI